jgi:small-conductance mechanosensitive channel
MSSAKDVPAVATASADVVTTSIAAIREMAEAGSPLSRPMLEKLSKEQVMDYHYKHAAQSAALESLASALTILLKRIDHSDATVAVLKATNQKLTEKCAALESRNTEYERRATTDAQYLRRRLMEVKNIPQQTNGPHLKPAMAELLSLTGEKVTPADIDVCHTQGKGVIMEFHARSKRDAILRGRKNLKSKYNEMKSLKMDKAMVLESLCKGYGELDYVCRQLAQKKKVYKTWFFNGRLNIEVEPGDQRKISHITDLHTLFGVELINGILG